MKLLVSQRNKIFDLIWENGLAPQKFQIENNKDNLILKYKETEYFLEISYLYISSARFGYEVKMCPGKESYEYTERYAANSPQWETIFTCVEMWIDNLKR